MEGKGKNEWEEERGQYNQWPMAESHDCGPGSAKAGEHAGQKEKDWHQLARMRHVPFYPNFKSFKIREGLYKPDRTGVSAD